MFKYYLTLYAGYDIFRLNNQKKMENAVFVSLTEYLMQLHPDRQTFEVESMRFCLQVFG